MEKKQVELLAPAGSIESMKAAINSGADAVYIGGSMFGARAYADNPNTDCLLEAIDYVHLHGKSLYLTVNTLLKTKELNNLLFDYLKPYYERGLDAVIVQDIGVFNFIKKNFPKLPIHASTQMTICGVEGAKLLKELGAARIVTARELSLDEIKLIHKNVDIEIESFVHGALCYCYSGQCLLSSFIGGRSGNRGRCAQPCRLPYKVVKEQNVINQNKDYILSPKDMCTIELIPDIIEAGVYSFKIEGRMKKPEYTAGVVRIYRKYIDMYINNGREGFKVAEHDKRELFDIFNRCGFNSGYYNTQNGRDMITLTPPQKRVRNEQLYKELSIYSEKEFDSAKIKIDGHLSLKKGQNARLVLKAGDITIEALGDIVEAAKKQPVDRERIEKQINKTGNTAFIFNNIEMDLDSDIFLPIKSINDLRRLAIDKLSNKIISNYRRNRPVLNGRSSDDNINPAEAKQERAVIKENKIVINACVETEEQLKAVVTAKELSAIYIDCTMVTRKVSYYSGICHTNNKKCYIVLPYILRHNRQTKLNEFNALLDDSIDGVVVKNLEEYAYLKDNNYKKSIIIDYNVYTFNREARNFWSDKIDYATAPIELNYRELKELGVYNSELIVYGYLPVMVSAQCIHNTIEGCDKKETGLYIRDRMNESFYVKNNCKYCYNVIYNCKPLVLLDNKADILKLMPRSLRLNFTTESGKAARLIAEQYIDSFIRNKEAHNNFNSFTRGHFKRGIE